MLDGFQQIALPHDVRVECLRGRVPRSRHVAFRCQVEDPVGLDRLNHALHIVGISDVALVEDYFPLEVVGSIFLAQPPSRPVDFN